MTEGMEGRIITVAALNRYVSGSLKADPILKSVTLRGEISGFKPYSSGWFFDLKDEEAKISCVMWLEAARRSGYTPRNGDQVIIHGSVGLYPRYGQYRLDADLIRPDGTGALWERFERLKEKLRAEGLFDQSRKRPLPPRPRRIAVVTSAEGAVWHDIRKISAQRNPGVALVLVPVRVQGDGAAREIAAAIPRAAALPEVDLLIVGRGGGSMQELWCFNEECVARAIAACPLPVISAVGHETDVTIADFVADLRASTPSNAAELAVPDREDMLEGLAILRRRLGDALERLMARRRLALTEARQRLAQLSPEVTLQRSRARAEQLRLRLSHSLEAALGERTQRLREDALSLDRALEGQLRLLSARAERQRARLEALNPLSVLNRGYALVMDGDRPVTRASEAPEHMTLRFADGKVAVRREEEKP